MSTTTPTPDGTIICPKCGTANLQNNFKCTACGINLHPTIPSGSGIDGTLGGLIPYKNGRALAAYYCGVFGLIPCLGLPIAVTAVVLGILGLKFAKAHPESKGQVHALIGIVLGSFTLLITLLVIVLAVAQRIKHGQH